MHLVLWELPDSGETSTKHEINTKRCHKAYPAVFPDPAPDLTNINALTASAEWNGSEMEGLCRPSEMVKREGKAGPEGFPEMTPPGQDYRSVHPSHSQTNVS